MKALALIITLALLATGAYFFNHREQPVGAAHDYASNEATLIRYIAKQESEKGKDSWESNPYVQQVRTDGQLDMHKVKSLFVERGIMTGEEFDTAYATIQAQGYSDSKGKAKLKAVNFYKDQKAQKEAEATVADQPEVASSTPSI